MSTKNPDGLLGHTATAAAASLLLAAIWAPVVLALVLEQMKPEEISEALKNTLLKLESKWNEEPELLDLEHTGASTKSKKRTRRRRVSKLIRYWVGDPVVKSCSDSPKLHDSAYTLADEVWCTPERLQENAEMQKVEPYSLPDDLWQAPFVNVSF